MSAVFCLSWATGECGMQSGWMHPIPKSSNGICKWWTLGHFRSFMVEQWFEPNFPTSQPSAQPLAQMLPLYGRKLPCNIKERFSPVLLHRGFLYITAKLTNPPRKRWLFSSPSQTGVWSFYPPNPCLSVLQILLAVICKGSFVRAAWSVWFLICLKYFPCWWQLLNSRRQWLSWSLHCHLI